MHGLCFFSALSFQAPLDRTDAADLLLEFLLGMTICFVDGLSRFTEIMKMAQLVGHIGKDSGHGFADRELSIREQGMDWHRDDLFGFSEQGGQIFFGGTQERSRQHNLSREHLTNDPEN